MNTALSLRRFAIVLLALFFPCIGTAQPSMTPVNYRLDVKKSKLNWKAPKSAGNRHFGYLLFNGGSITFSNEGLPRTGSFSINANTITSTDHPKAADNKRVDDQLKSAEFFDVKQFPEAGIVVSAITPSDKAGSYQVKGLLTIKNRTGPVEFSATVQKTGNTVTAKGDLVINRQKWNISPASGPKEQRGWNLLATIKDNLIEDDIPIRLDLVFQREK